MEDVFEVYHRPYDEKRPVICMDGQPVQFHGEKQEPLPVNERHSKQEDNKYVCKGTYSVFMFIEPLKGRRYVSASARRTGKDWAREIKSPVKEQYPQAEKVAVVMDNLNTHTVSPLYETFPAEKAFETARKPEVQYTPKHGSWLNIAETALSGMTSQCLNRRIDTLEKLSSEPGAWQLARNSNRKMVDWQFTTEDARIKLHGLYPEF